MVFIGLILMLIPFFHEVYLLIPDDIEFLDFYFFRIDDLGFGRFDVAMYYLVPKIAYLLPLLLWFFMEKSWWRYALLSPIIAYLFQVASILDPNQFYMDEIELYKAAYLLAILAILLVVLSKAAYKQSYFLALYTKILRQRELYILKNRAEKRDISFKKRWKQLQNTTGKDGKKEIEELQVLK
ncbi:MAG: hypothetical protein AAF348_19110 [Bacteroidota bacterium]